MAFVVSDSLSVCFVRRSVCAFAAVCVLCGCGVCVGGSCCVLLFGCVCAVFAELLT